MNIYLKLRYWLDRLVATFLLILLSPLIVVSIALIKLDGGPIFFKQKRVGFGGKQFTIIKLRTMINNADDFLDEAGKPTRERITLVGKFLRRSSIDELPQLINIILGEMALIGPRPILPSFVDYMTEHEFRRFEILPGLSGWAQINGRNKIKWSERFKLDIYYIDNVSLMLDSKIAWSTFLSLWLKNEVVHDRNPEVVDDISTREKISRSEIC